MHERSGRLSAGLVAVLLVATGCEGGDARDPDRDPAPSEPTFPDAAASFVLDFDDATVRHGQILGASPDGASVVLVTEGGGALLSSNDAGGGAAAQFPDPTQPPQGALAALLLTPTPGTDTFDPGTHDFGFGLDVLLPELPDRTVTDDGDNLIQRGLFGDEGQFKLQIDGGRPSCRVAGDTGEVLVKSDRTVEPGRWYRLRCERIGDRVDLFVGELTGGAPTRWWAWSEPGPTGDIEPGNPGSTVSIGAKLNPAGEIVQEAPDQFSGALDRVQFTVGR